MVQFRYLLIGLIAAAGTIVFSGCGGGGSGQSTKFKAQVVMGPIIGANVSVYRADDQFDTSTTQPATPIAVGLTRDGTPLANAGGFEVSIPLENLEEPLYIVVSGGVDIDVDDDGVRDEEYTENTIRFEFMVPSANDLANLRLTTKFNPLLLLASGYAIGNLYDEGEVSNEGIKMVLRSVAKAFLTGEDQDGDGLVDDLDGDGFPDDINSDGHIDWQDIVTFNPTNEEHKAKCRMPWEFLLAELDRQRNGYNSTLRLQYIKYFAFDPHVIANTAAGGSMHPIDHDNDGSWIDEEDPYDFFQLVYSTTLNNYTLQDLVDGQGMIGGDVSFPEPLDLFYGYYEFGNGNSECDYIQKTAAGHLPLALNCIEVADDAATLLNQSLGVDVGGFVYEPARAPEGIYNVTYKTGDGQNHQESFYIHEISEDSYVHAIPQVYLDDQKRIEHITLRFEDVYGNELIDPPVLQCVVWMNPNWSSPEEANQLLRGAGYYAPGLNLYNSQVDYLGLTKPIYPTNNGHKIYIEDVNPIYIGILTGDGVQRSFGFYLDQTYLPQIETLELAGGNVTASYVSSSETGKPVESITYRFDNTDWSEVAGNSVTTEVPPGAGVFYVTATDDSNFYAYPPDTLQID